MHDGVPSQNCLQRISQLTSEETWNGRLWIESCHFQSKSTEQYRLSLESNHGNPPPSEMSHGHEFSQYFLGNYLSDLLDLLELPLFLPPPAPAVKMVPVSKPTAKKAAGAATSIGLASRNLEDVFAAIRRGLRTLGVEPRAQASLGLAQDEASSDRVAPCQLLSVQTTRLKYQE